MELRFGIIGCGRIGMRHAVHAANNGRLVAVCDIDKEKADAIAAQYQCISYTAIEDLLNSATKPDVIAVCTPNGLHATHTITSLQAGMHVLCEKPMALYEHDCRAMVVAATEAGKQLFIVKQNRYNPPVAAVKQALQEGRLGKLYSLQLNCFWQRNADYYNDPWRGTLTLDGGTLYTQFSHFIDLLNWMVGPVKTVQAVMANYAHQGIIEFEDTGVVLLTFENGVIGTINYTVNSCQQNMEGSLTLFGEKGTVKIGGQYLNELEYQAIDDYRIENLRPGNTANQYGAYAGSMSNHDKVYENLVNVLQHQAAMMTSAEEGLQTVSLIEKIYQQAIRL